MRGYECVFAGPPAGMCALVSQAARAGADHGHGRRAAVAGTTVGAFDGAIRKEE